MSTRNPLKGLKTGLRRYEGSLLLQKTLLGSQHSMAAIYNSTWNRLWFLLAPGMHVVYVEAITHTRQMQSLQKEPYEDEAARQSAFLQSF